MSMSNLCKDYSTYQPGDFNHQCFMDLLVRLPNGTIEVYLPGNELFPNYLKHRINDDDLLIIADVLLDLRSVTKLNLAYNNIEDKGLKLLAPVIQGSPNIMELNLMKNNFTGKGLLDLVWGLLNRHPMTSLKLCGNKIGNLGVKALVCLILAGKCPLDLDLGDCDLTVEDFQILISALAGIDRDIDFPRFIQQHVELSISLNDLKEMKMEWNNEARHITRINKLKNSEVKKDPKGKPQPGLIFEDKAPEVYEHFSATVLNGLSSLEEHAIRLKAVESGDLSKSYEDVEEILKEAEKFPVDVHQMAQIIKDKIKEKGKPGLTMEGDPLIVERTLYSLNMKKIPRTRKQQEKDALSMAKASVKSPKEAELDNKVVKELINDFRERVKKGKKADCESSRSSIKRLLSAQFMKEEEGETDDLVTDKYVAREATEYVIEELIQEAGERAGRTELEELTNVNQLLLMTVVELLAKEKGNGNNALTDNQCFKIFQKAHTRVKNIMVPRLTPECKLSETDLNTFVDKIYNSNPSNETDELIDIRRNYVIFKKVGQASLVSCWEGYRREMRAQATTLLAAESRQDFLRASIQFVEGAIQEAARLIGSCDPFGAKGKAPNLPKDLDVENIKEALFPVLEEIIETSEILATGGMHKAREVAIAEEQYKATTSIFVDELFHKVYDAVLDIKPWVPEGPGGEDLKRAKYPYISRPTRLVFNRPIIPHYEKLMSTMIGDYLKTNKTIKVLHMQKFPLEECGLLSLMAGLRLNMTMVLLDLSCNALGCEGMKELGPYIAENKSLKHLVLKTNQIRDAGMRYITDNVVSSNLISLDISKNGLTDVSLDPFFAIFTATKLKSIYLWGSQFEFTTFQLMKRLMTLDYIRQDHTDVYLQEYQGQVFVVKNSQIRDVNEWHEVPPIRGEELSVPLYFLEDSHKEAPSISLYVPMTPPVSPK